MKQFTLFLAGILCAAGVASSIPDPVDYESFADDFQITEKTFAGNWAGGNQWKSLVCNGKYQYTSWTRGLIEHLDFQFVAEGKIGASIDLNKIQAGVGGSFRGPESLCVPVGGSYSISIAWAKILADATYDDNGEGLTNLKIQIRETRLGKIELGSWVPDWLENLLTKVVNSGLKKVWSSALGSWINNKISENLKGKFPPAP